MTINIFKVSSDPKNNVLLNDLKKSYLKKTASRLQTVVNTRVEKIAKLGVNALKSKVPINTGELRDQHIYLSNVVSKEHPMTYVIIDGNPHTSGKYPNSKDKFTEADKLAMFLDKDSPNKRSRNSEPIDPFTGLPEKGKHKGWIASAKAAFYSALRSGKY